MAAVTARKDEEDQRRLLRQYLAQIPKTHVALRRFVDDTRLVLDSLTAQGASTSESRLAERMDLGRIGVFGHSMGGVTAGQFCLEDSRCRAGLNLDGIPQYGTMIDGRLDRPFLMVYSERPGRAGASDPIYRRTASPYYRVDVKDTLHLDFSDMIFWRGRLEEGKALGTLAPARAAAITRAIVRQFFDLTLRGGKAPLLEGVSPVPEVSVRRFP